MAKDTATTPSNEAKIRSLKRRIEGIRKSMKSPAAMRSQEMQQKYYDEIAKLNREIEQLTRATRKVVPVIGAPVFCEKPVAKTPRRKGFTL